MIVRGNPPIFFNRKLELDAHKQVAKVKGSVIEVLQWLYLRKRSNNLSTEGKNMKKSGS